MPLWMKSLVGSSQKNLTGSYIFWFPRRMTGGLRLHTLSRLGHVHTSFWPTSTAQTLVQMVCLRATREQILHRSTVFPRIKRTVSMTKYYLMYFMTLCLPVYFIGHTPFYMAKGSQKVTISPPALRPRSGQKIPTFPPANFQDTFSAPQLADQ